MQLLNQLGAQDEDDIELKDAQRIQLTRQLLMKWVTEPFFADTVQGCLVRGKATTGYWIASVADVEIREPGPCKYGLRVLGGRDLGFGGNCMLVPGTGVMSVPAACVCGCVLLMCKRFSRFASGTHGTWCRAARPCALHCCGWMSGAACHHSMLHEEISSRQSGGGCCKLKSHLQRPG